MEKTILIPSIISGVLILFLISTLIRIGSRKNKLREIEYAIMELYYGKINKLPALVEIMKLHTTHDDICTEMIRLHRATIITRIDSIYDLLELNNRIHREFLFLMKVSAKIRDLHRNGNFLYIRDFLAFYETNINKLILEYNRELINYNNLIVLKNYSLFGLLIPIQKKLAI